jgi:hypothetical protein
VSPPSSSSLAEEKRLPSLPWPPSGQGSTYTTTVTRHGRVDLRIGAVLPDGATVTSATLNGSPVEPKLAQTTRGLEAVISAPPEQGTATLVVNIEN